jgi:hypothetical protein
MNAAAAGLCSLQLSVGHIDRAEPTLDGRDSAVGVWGYR